MNSRGTHHLRHLAVALTALALTGCSASVSTGGGLDTDEAEDVIAGEIEAQSGLAVTVACPDDVELEAGGTFACTATDDETGETREIAVEQTDAEGNISWELE